MRCAASLLLLLLVTVPAHAQPPLRGHVFELNTRQRWLHGREQPRFDAFATRRQWIYIDSVDSGGARRTLHLKIVNASPYARLVQNEAGDVLERFAEPRRLPIRPGEDSLDAVRRRANLLGQLAIPERYLWHLAPAPPPEGAQPGAQWTDTLRLDVEQDGHRQALEGVRVTTLLGDTMVNGTRHRILRDSARMHYVERAMEEERTIDDFVTIVREVDGILRGTSLYDPAIRLLRSRDDTIAAAGQATLTYPDGRRFTTAARFERTSDLTLRDSVADDARRAELRAQRRAEFGGMVIAPANEFQERLASGDSVLRDSVFDAWDRATDPDERVELLRVLVSWARVPRGRVTARAFEAGDTAYFMEQWGWSVGEKLDSVRLAFLLPFMRDPGLPFAFGLPRDPPYENIRQQILQSPPAITEDTAAWECIPAVCEWLIREASGADEPRLRDLGLLIAFTMDPARWADSIRARVDAGSAFLQEARYLVDGVGYTTPVAAKTPMPPPGSDWRTWLFWMSGRAPDQPPPRSGPELTVRFSTSHTNAIRFHSIISGRDVIGEIRDAHASAQDSAQLVFGAMLRGLGELVITADSLVAWLRSGSAPARELAERELPYWFWRAESTPADSATANELIDHALAIAIRRAPPWPDLDGSITRPGFALSHAPSDGSPVFIVTDQLPAALHEKWAASATLVTRDEASARDRRLPAVLYSLREVQTAGPFASVHISYTRWHARTPEEAPQGYAGGYTYFLLRTEDGWRTAAIMQWVT